MLQGKPLEMERAEIVRLAIRYVARVTHCQNGISTGRRRARAPVFALTLCRIYELNFGRQRLQAQLGCMLPVRAQIMLWKTEVQSTICASGN